MDNDNLVKKEHEDAPNREVDQRQEQVRAQSISPLTQGLPCYFPDPIYALSDAV